MASSSSSPAPPPPSRPRNPRLSAYYSASVSSTSTSLPGAALPPTASPVPSSHHDSSAPPSLRAIPVEAGEAAVIEHISDLTRRCELPSLMQLSSELRGEASSLTSSLQHTTIESYRQLTASRDANHQLGALLDRQRTLADHNLALCDTASHINSRLSGPRSRVAALHATQRVATLRAAATAVARHLDELCADDLVLADARLLLVAKRCFAISNVLRRLAPYSSDFKGDSSRLEEAAKRNRSLLINHFEAADAATPPIPVVQFATLRALLLDDLPAIRAHAAKVSARFVAAAADAVTQQARQVAASKSKAVGIACLHAAVAKREVIPKLFQVARWHDDIAASVRGLARAARNSEGVNGDAENENEKRNGSNEVDESEDTDNVVYWLNDIVAETISSRIKSSFTAIHDDDMDRPAVDELLHAVQTLATTDDQPISDGGSKQAETDGEHTTTADSTNIVQSVLQACADELTSHVNNVVRQHVHESAARALAQLVGTDRDVKEIKFDTLAEQVRDRLSTLCKQWDQTGDDEASMLQAIATSSDSFSRSPDLAFQHYAYAYRVATELGARPATAPLADLCKRRARLAVTATARASVHAAVTQLRYADDVGRLCGVHALKRSRDVVVLQDDDDDEVTFLDDGWLGKVVIKAWLDLLGARRPLNDTDLAAARKDAKALMDAVGYDVSHKLDRMGEA